MSTIQHGDGGYQARDHGYNRSRGDDGFCFSHAISDISSQLLSCFQHRLSQRLKFQKAESDLDYIQHKLEFEIMKSLPDNPAAEENPVTLLEELSVVKSRYKMLCVQLEKVSIEQRESMNCIRAALENTMKTVQALQQHTDLERLPLSEEEQAAAQQLTCQTVKEMESLAEEPFSSESTVPDSTEESQFKPLTEETLMTVPRSIRSTVKLADLNNFYRELFNHFVINKNRAALSVSQMNKMNMKATDSRVRILKELSVVELDKHGNVKLVA
ncbi:spindle and kinetochore-associated protein 2 isoform X3 [Struthio camelus]|uniref:spindle and kinetochore-associated protein 2 isoform X3 n=1 Tax=Struthio camelus TaxID=8801 RepID=UPI003604254A